MVARGARAERTRLDLTPYLGKRFTLWLTDDKEESVVYAGWTASLCGETLLLERQGGELELQSDWLERIQPVPQGDSRRILQDGDYFLRLFVGRAADSDIDFKETGMKWPQ